MGKPAASSDMYVLAADLQARMRALAAQQQLASQNTPKAFEPDGGSSIRTAVTIAHTRLRAALDKRKLSSKITPKVSLIVSVDSRTPAIFHCLESLSRQRSQHAFEVIVMDSSTERSGAWPIGAIPGVQHVHHRKQGNPIYTYNTAVTYARGDVLVLLDSHTVALGGWLDALVDRLLNDSTIGMVGSKLLKRDGRLHEAGAIIGNDASLSRFGGQHDAGNFEFNYARDVDYCSLNGIALRKTDFARNNGLDRKYRSLEYAAADLALRVRHKLNKRIVYEPHAVAQRQIADSDITEDPSRYFRADQARLLSKWQTPLRKQYYPQGANPLVAARHGKRKRVLVVDSLVPEYDRDSGSLRMSQILKSLVKLDYDVTLFADNRVATQPYTSALQAFGIEIVYGGMTLQDFYRERADMYQVVVLSTPLTAIWHLEYCRGYLPKAHIIYDTVDLHFLRIARQAEAERRAALKSQADKWQKLETYIMSKTAATWVVSYDEQKLLQTVAPDVRVQVVSNINKPVPLPSRLPRFEQRRNLLFIGSRHTPNEDAVIWFCDKILPLVRRELPDVELTLLGSSPSDAVLKRANNYVHVPGYIEDVDQYFSEAKVFICPLRYGAGVKGKVSQAMSFCLPVVSTSVGIEGMHAENEKDFLLADDPEAFARQIIRLYTDPKLWTTISQSSRKIYDANFSEAAGLRSLRDALR